MSGNKDSDGGWKKFLWNSEKGEFLGRTGSSWCLSHTPRSEKHEIVYNKSDRTSFKKYIESMDKLLENYEESNQTEQKKYEDCGGKYKPIINQGLSYSLADP
ncbi:hypothetical protein INR49_008478 [Caranx melampygus]|nr:hypothetical protein INR49_008478 [Caranx melampygus]